RGPRRERVLGRRRAAAEVGDRRGVLRPRVRRGDTGARWSLPALRKLCDRALVAANQERLPGPQRLRASTRSAGGGVLAMERGHAPLHYLRRSPVHRRQGRLREGAWPGRDHVLGTAPRSRGGTGGGCSGRFALRFVWGVAAVGKPIPSQTLPLKGRASRQGAAGGPAHQSVGA